MAIPKVIQDIRTLYTENDTQDTTLNSKSNKSVRVSITLSSSSWSSGIYTISNANITATNIVELYPTTTITTDQLEALQGANIIGGTQAAGSIQLVAKGDVPTINIPVILIIRGDI